MIVPRVGDTQEFVVVNRMPVDESGHPRKPRWSPVRTRTAAVALIVTFAFIIEVILRPRHGLNQLPQIALDVARANWVVALLCLLASWAYDTIAPKVWQRLAVLRHGLRELGSSEERILEMQRSHAKDIAALRAGQQSILDETRRENQSVAEKIDQLVAGLKEVADKIGDHDLDTYIEGFNRARERTAARIPAQAVSAENEGAVVRMPARYFDRSERL